MPQEDRDIYRVVSVQSANWTLPGGEPRSRRVRRRHMEYVPEMMPGGLETTMVEPSRFDFSMQRS